MKVLANILLFSCTLVCAQQSEVLSKRDKKLLKFKKEVDRIGEDLETFAFDIAKEVVKKSDLYLDTDYDDEENYPSEEDYQDNDIPKEPTTTEQPSKKSRTKRSPQNATEHPEDLKPCYEKPPEEQHLERLHIADLKEEIKHLYELVSILRDQQKILSALDKERDVDADQRFDPKDLLRVLEHLNNNEAENMMAYSTQEELAKIKWDLKKAVSALDQTKNVLVQGRKQELALEVELQRQKAELQMLRQLYSNDTKSGKEASLVGSPQHLPKALPATREEARELPSQARTSKTHIANPRSRSSEFKHLARLLDKLDTPKKENKDLEQRAKKVQLLEKLLADEEEEDKDPTRRILVQLLEKMESRGDEEDVQEELRKLQSAIERLRPKEEASVVSDPLRDFFGGRQQSGGTANVKLTQQQLLELRKKLNQMIAQGTVDAGQSTSNFDGGNFHPTYPFWPTNYRNLGPYPNFPGPNVYAYDRGQYGPEQNPPYSGYGGYYPENRPFGRDYWTNRYRYTNRFFPATSYVPEDAGTGDPGQAGSYLQRDYQEKDVEELKVQIDNLQSVIDSLNYSNYGKRPEDEATVANLQRQIKDLRGIVNSLNQEVPALPPPPSYNQPPPSYIQPPPSYIQPPSNFNNQPPPSPSYNQPSPDHEPPNDPSQQSYGNHQAVKRSAVPENASSKSQLLDELQSKLSKYLFGSQTSDYNEPRYDQASSHSPPSYNQVLSSLAQPPPSYNQFTPDLESSIDLPQHSSGKHQLTKRSAGPEDTSTSSQLLDQVYSKLKTYLFEGSQVDETSNLNARQNVELPLSYQQPLTSYNKLPSSYNQLPPRYDELPPSYNQLPPSYNELSSGHNQLPTNYKQLPPSYKELPPSYSELPPSYNKLHPSSNQLPPKYKQLSSNYDELPPNYNQLPPSYNKLPPSYNKLPSDHNQLPTNYKQLPPSYKQLPSNYDELSVSYNQLPPSYNELPSGHNQLSTNYNQLSPSYNELYPSHKELPPSYSELPPSYSELPLSFGQAPSGRVPLIEPPGSFYRRHQVSRRSAAPVNASSDSQLLDQVYSELKAYLLEDDQPSGRSSFDDAEEKISNLKAQLDNRYRSYPGTERYDRPPSAMSPRSYYYQPYERYVYSYPASNQIQKLLPKKDDLLGSIIAKVIGKVVAALPTIFAKLFGSAFYGLTDVDDQYGYVSDGYGQNGVQSVLKSFGVVGYVPLILLKLVNGLEAFIGVLKRNKFFGSFLLPVLVLLVVAGSVIFLIWWFQGGDDTNYKQIGYVNQPDQAGYKYPSQYSKSMDAQYSGNLMRNPAQTLVPGYSRSYYDNERKNTLELYAR